jgi:hypothetical protein
MNCKRKQYDGEIENESKDPNYIKEDDLKRQENLPTKQTDLLLDQEYMQHLTDSDLEQVSGGLIQGAIYGAKEGWKIGYQGAKEEGSGIVKRVTEGAKIATAAGTLGLVTSKPWLQALGFGAK